MRRGLTIILIKPVERLQLIARVRSLLRQKAYTDELERAESVLFALARSIGLDWKISVFRRKFNNRCPFNIEPAFTAGSNRL